eukprot:scaffold65433_cov66-Phaeocystis_antarctica.AAC.8
MLAPPGFGLSRRLGLPPSVRRCADSTPACRRVVRFPCAHRTPVRRRAARRRGRAPRTPRLARAVAWLSACP